MDPEDTSFHALGFRINNLFLNLGCYGFFEERKSASMLDKRLIL